MNHTNFVSRDQTVNASHCTGTAICCTIIGNHNVLNCTNCVIIGNHNTIHGDNNELTGNHNRSTGLNNRATGNHNNMIQRCTYLPGPDIWSSCNQIDPKNILAVPYFAPPASYSTVACGQRNNTNTMLPMPTFEGSHNAPIKDFSYADVDKTKPSSKLYDKPKEPKVNSIKLPAPIPDEKDNIDGVPDQFLCVQCNERLKKTVCLPCGHCFFCVTCALVYGKTKDKCPICNEGVQEIKRQYM